MMKGWKEISLEDFAVLTAGSVGSEHPQDDGCHIVHQREGVPFALLVDGPEGSKFYQAEIGGDGDPPISSLISV